jgi:acyl-CoA synthetase (NDP forming)
MLDVCLQLASLRPGQLPAGDRVLISTFGGGSGVVATDQCTREGLQVPPLDEATKARVMPLLTPLSSAINPIDLTPGLMTQPKYRANMPAALRVLAESPGLDAWMFMAAGFGELAPELIEIFDQLRKDIDKPICLTWQSMPQGTAEALAARGIYVFTEHARAARALGHLVRYAADLRLRGGRLPAPAEAFPWERHVTADGQSEVLSEDVAARIMEAAGLPVARGRLATSAAEAVRVAEDVGYPVAIKAISAAVTHRAAAGLVALNLDNAAAVEKTETAFRARAAELGATLDGVWVQRMFSGDRELLVTALRDAEFGVLVGCGVGGGQTEVVDDVVFARAPIDAAGALELIDRLRTVRRMPQWLSDAQRNAAADFIARFSRLVASAPWQQFTFEINPVKLSRDDLAAVDGLLIIG